MIKVLLFGRLGDLHSGSSIDIELNDSLKTASDVRDRLSSEFPDLSKALSEPQTLIALNQKIVGADQPLSSGDELAFLPPVTGG
jgi:molybdopterin synthase sulfur carrier subunit